MYSGTGQGESGTRQPPDCLDISRHYQRPTSQERIDTMSIPYLVPMAAHTSTALITQPSCPTDKSGIVQLYWRQP